MSLKEILNSNTELYVDGGLYYQKDLNNSSAFEKLYLELRQKEGRLYPDEVVKKLPELSFNHIHQNEWAIRKTSALWLISYLKNKSHLKNILEVGCGNGWLSNMLARTLPVEVCGVDTNEKELTQASRLFEFKRLYFIKANVMESFLFPGVFDVIILASSIQYFSALNLLIERLLDLLTLRGEIHIIDSPICYSKKESAESYERSSNYFGSLGLEKMSDHYHYHTFDALTGFCHKVIFNPKAFLPVFKRKVFGIQSTPFPWIKIVRINKIDQN